MIVHVLRCIFAIILPASTGGWSTGQVTVPTWTVAAKPELRIGTEGDPPYEFNQVIGVARLADGSIVVANRGTREVRVYGSDGRFQRTFGGKGAGPGEYEQPQWLGHRADTAFIYDLPLDRLTALDTRSGGVVESRVYQAGAARSVIARLSSGALLAESSPPIVLTRPDGARRDSSTIVVLAPDASGGVVTIGTFPGLSTYAVNPANSGRARSVGVNAFAPQLHVLPIGTRIVVGDAAVPLLLIFDESGRKTGEIRLPIPMTRYDNAAMDRLKSALLATATSERDRTAIEQRFNPRYRPRERPYFQGLLAGPCGEVWVERFREDPSASSEFIVVGENRQVAANVRGPAGVRVFEAGLDYLLGVSRDRDGVERVVLYRYGR